MTVEVTSKTKWLIQRRKERLRREITFLEHLDTKLWRKIAICAGLSIVLLAALLFAVGAMFHLDSAHPAIALAICIGTAIGLYWGTRFSLSAVWIAALIVSIIVFQDIDILFNGYSSSGKSIEGGADDLKARKQTQIAKAIQKRRYLIEKLSA